jgi:hypothetical protein
VRLEIVRALQRDIRVIPVLVSATMPKESEVPSDLAPLVRRHAVDLTDRHWKQDVEGLAQALERIPGFGTRPVRPGAARSSILRSALLGVGVPVVLAVGVWLALRQPAGTDTGTSAASPAAAAAPLDLSQWVRIRDTGTEGAVAGLAMVTAMEASLAQQRRPVALSARYLYEKAKTVDRFGTIGPGTDMTAAVYVAETFGAPPEDRWPYISGSRALPKGVTWAEMDQEAAKFRARLFRLADYDDIKEQLAKGRPVVATIDVTSAWGTEEAMKTGLIRPTDQDEVQGLSVVVIVGFAPADGSVVFANEWGVGWGANGFGRMLGADGRTAFKDLWAVEVPRP